MKRDAVERELPVVTEAGGPQLCRHLRTKTAYGSDGRAAEWMRGESTTAVFWCLRTMESFGPDGSFCHPHQCGVGRGCHRTRDDA